jgi:CheY-like chemotaxis protein
MTAPCESILIIEDDESIRETLKIFLEFEGYRVLTAENGKVGLDLLPGLEKVCLILVDLMMPVMDGWQFIERAGADQRFAATPIVVVTAFVERSHGIAARAVLRKPVDLDYLLKTVREYCGPAQNAAA